MSCDCMQIKLVLELHAPLCFRQSIKPEFQMSLESRQLIFGNLNNHWLLNDFLKLDYDWIINKEVI